MSPLTMRAGMADQGEPDFATREAERRRRMVENEAAARAFNELAVESGPPDARPDCVTILCECGDASCHQRLEVPRRLYDGARADPRRFLVRRGHVYPDLERVADRIDEVELVEKL